MSSLDLLLKTKKSPSKRSLSLLRILKLFKKSLIITKRKRMPQSKLLKSPKTIRPEQAYPVSLMMLLMLVEKISPRRNQPKSLPRMKKRLLILKTKVKKSPKRSQLKRLPRRVKKKLKSTLLLSLMPRKRRLVAEKPVFPAL